MRLQASGATSSAPTSRGPRRGDLLACRRRRPRSASALVDTNRFRAGIGAALVRGALARAGRPTALSSRLAAPTSLRSSSTAARASRRRTKSRSCPACGSRVSADACDASRFAEAVESEVSFERDAFRLFHHRTPTRNMTSALGQCSGCPLIVVRERARQVTCTRCPNQPVARRGRGASGQLPEDGCPERRGEQLQQRRIGAADRSPPPCARAEPRPTPLCNLDQHVRVVGAPRSACCPEIRAASALPSQRAVEQGRELVALTWFGLQLDDHLDGQCTFLPVAKVHFDPAVSRKPCSRRRRENPTPPSLRYSLHPRQGSSVSAEENTRLVQSA